MHFRLASDIVRRCFWLPAASLSLRSGTAGKSSKTEEALALSSLLFPEYREERRLETESEVLAEREVGDEDRPAALMSCLRTGVGDFRVRWFGVLRATLDRFFSCIVK